MTGIRRSTLAVLAFASVSLLALSGAAGKSGSHCPPGTWMVQMPGLRGPVGRCVPMGPDTCPAGYQLELSFRPRIGGYLPQRIAACMPVGVGGRLREASRIDERVKRAVARKPQRPAATRARTVHPPKRPPAFRAARTIFRPAPRWRAPSPSRSWTRSSSQLSAPRSYRSFSSRSTSVGAPSFTFGGRLRTR